MSIRIPGIGEKQNIHIETTQKKEKFKKAILTFEGKL